MDYTGSNEYAGAMATDTSGTGPGLANVILTFTIIGCAILGIAIIVSVIEHILLKKEKTNIFIKIINYVLVIVFGILPISVIAEDGIYAFDSLINLVGMTLLLLPSILILIKNLSKNVTIKKRINIAIIIFFTIAFVAIASYCGYHWFGRI